MIKHKITLKPLGKVVEVNDDTPLIDVLNGFGIEFPCGGKGTCGKCRVKLAEGEITVSPKHGELIDKLNLAPEWRLSCMSRCTSDITLEIDQFNHIILADETEFEFTPKTGFGIAVDLGTSTLVVQLLNLTNARIIGVETLVNPQVKFGADLISRIQAAMDGKLTEMTQVIRKTIGDVIENMVKKYDIEPLKVSIVGNTAMKLMFGGRDLTSLSAYPFITQHLDYDFYKPEELEWNFKVGENVVFYPSIGSFVGSDILAGIAATRLFSKTNLTALIDLGTNGEIVVGNCKKIVCASTAAGPAFEGSNISMGMRAITGAISSLSIENNLLNPTVIGNTTSRGICGSGLIDAVALLRETEKIGDFGEIHGDDDTIYLTEKVTLSQKDIHEFQLAKAAIAAGLEILCSNLGYKIDDLEEIYISGGFGNYVNLLHVTATGMIEAPPEKIKKMGNTALVGAKMFLFDDKPVISEILSKTTHVNLESDPLFQDIYVGKLMLY